MKNRFNLIAIAGLLMVSLAFSSCFGRWQRNAAYNDRIKKRNGTYHRKHYYGRSQIGGSGWH